MIGLLLWAAMMLFTWFSGCWKVLLAIFLMMSLHEAAHCLAAMLVHVPGDTLKIVVVTALAPVLRRTLAKAVPNL